MTVLALDPGTEVTAFVAMHEGVCVWHGMKPNEDVVSWLRSDMAMMPESPRLVACEMIASYGMPVGREVFETCVWIGRFREAVAARPWKLVYRQDVKLELCGSTRAKDSNVRQALLDRFGGKAAALGTKKAPGPLHGLKADEWAALGVAIVASKESK